MNFSERLADKTNQQEKLRREFGQLRRRIHQSIKEERAVRMKENPRPTEEELYMAAFEEWLEPQVRDAIIKMNRKGYATESSGFDGKEFELQQIDGYFTIDEKTKDVLEHMGVQVLRGADIGLPKNKLVTILRFRAKQLSISNMKERWDAVAAVLPEKLFPPGIHPICDRAEIFREQYAPQHPSLDETREAYFKYMKGRGD
jgi:hypothetical protein